MALVVFLQEDEDVPNVYRNLKIFCETAPWMLFPNAGRKVAGLSSRGFIQCANLHVFNAMINHSLILNLI